MYSEIHIPVSGKKKQGGKRNKEQCLSACSFLYGCYLAFEVSSPISGPPLHQNHPLSSTGVIKNGHLACFASSLLLTKQHGWPFFVKVSAFLDGDGGRQIETHNSDFLNRFTFFLSCVLVLASETSFSCNCFVCNFFWSIYFKSENIKPSEFTFKNTEFYLLRVEEVQFISQPRKKIIVAGPEILTLIFNCFHLRGWLEQGKQKKKGCLGHLGSPFTYMTAAKQTYGTFTWNGRN